MTTTIVVSKNASIVKPPPKKKKQPSSLPRTNGSAAHFPETIHAARIHAEILEILRGSSRAVSGRGWGCLGCFLLREPGCSGAGVRTIAVLGKGRGVMQYEIVWRARNEGRERKGRQDKGTRREVCVYPLCWLAALCPGVKRNDESVCVCVYIYIYICVCEPDHGLEVADLDTQWQRPIECPCLGSSRWA